MQGRRFVLAAVAIAGLTIAAGSAGAQIVPSTPPANEPSRAADAKSVVAPKDKLKCEYVRVTGTRMPTRVCHTIAEREYRAEQARRLKDRMEQAPLSNRPSAR